MLQGNVYLRCKYSEGNGDGLDTYYGGYEEIPLWQAIHWNQQESLKRGKPRITWRSSIENEITAWRQA